MWKKVKVGWCERIALKQGFTMCKTDDHCRFDAWSRAPKLVLWKTQRDGVAGEVAGGFRTVGHMYTHGYFMSMYGKNYQIL